MWQAEIKIEIKMKKIYYDIVLYKLEYPVPHYVKRIISVLDPEFPRKGRQPQRWKGERQTTIRAHPKIVCVDLTLDLPKFISSEDTYILVPLAPFSDLTFLLNYKVNISSGARSCQD